VRSYTNSDLSDTDRIVPFENATSINLINLLCVLFILSFLFCVIEVVFSNAKSGQSESGSVKERTHTDQQKITFHMLGVRRSAMN